MIVEIIIIFCIILKYICLKNIAKITKIIIAVSYLPLQCTYVLFETEK